MGALALAGSISGMGQGLERGLQQMQGGLIQQGLADADRAFQSEKLKLQMEHAERLQQSSISAASGENEKNRALQTTLHQKTEEGATARQQQQIGGSLTAASIQAEGAKEAAAAHAASAEKIATMTNATHIKMNEATVNAQKYAADEHLTAALLNSYTESQRALQTDINRLEIIANDYKQDPNSPAYKNVLKELETQRKRSADLSAARDQAQIAIEKAKGFSRPEPTPPKRFVLPDMGGAVTPQSAPAPGPQSSVVPPSGPIDVTSIKERDPLSSIVGGLVPGLTGLANTLRK